jgi:hypothetical protein
LINLGGHSASRSKELNITEFSVCINVLSCLDFTPLSDFISIRNVEQICIFFGPCQKNLNKLLNLKKIKKIKVFVLRISYKDEKLLSFYSIILKDPI